MKEGLEIIGIPEDTGPKETMVAMDPGVGGALQALDLLDHRQ